VCVGPDTITIGGAPVTDCREGGRRGALTTPRYF
jgi:hypothetical protein